MDGRSSVPLVPLHLTSIAILSPSNAPLYIHSFTGKQDELRHYHLSHAAIDVIEERIVMTSTPTKPADSYLGLLFCMEDMAFYGFQTTTRLRMVLSVALVDAMVKDADIVAIFRAIHQLLLSVSSNPFLSLPSSFRAKVAPPAPPPGEKLPSSVLDELRDQETPRNESVPTHRMLEFGPEDIKTEWLEGSVKWNRGIDRLGALLNGGRA